MLLLALLVGVEGVRADGSLPPLPYHYLHPPAALAGNNTPPAAASATVPVRAGRAGQTLLFTRDGQIGIKLPAGALVATPSATSILLHIQAVDAPAGLPDQVTLDGNAYAMTATGRPGKPTITLRRPAGVTLRWPHTPIGIYLYRNGTWLRVCDSGHSYFTPTTISCPTAAFGIIAAVTTPGNASSRVPSTPLSSTPLAWLNRYLPLLAGIGLILLAVVLGYAVSRPENQPREED